MNPEPFMREAIDLALRGRGRVEPNPRVGALALEGERVVGRGWHDFYGGDHAEVAALEDAAREGADPDSLIVTLEPCSSAKGVAGKKTPACTQRLIDAGIRRLIYGAEDPDPRHAGAANSELECLRMSARRSTAPFCVGCLWTGPGPSPSMP
ncbi:MAG: deaminase [Planctomycetota bacterium]